MAGGWWLVAGGWWLVAGGEQIVRFIPQLCGLVKKTVAERLCSGLREQIAVPDFSQLRTVGVKVSRDRHRAGWHARGMAVAVITTPSAPDGSACVSATAQCWVDRLVRTGVAEIRKGPAASAAA